MNIALDVMGGDFAPLEVIKGGLMWVEQSPHQLILVGQEELIAHYLKDYAYDSRKVQVVNASQIVEMDESPAHAIRKKKDSSIVVATRLVKEGQADALLSCGSTGAQMAAAIFILGRIETIERPPIVASIPAGDGKFSLLMDVGANVDCRPRHLLQFALLGKAYASIVMGLDNPRVALINNGSEEGKGNSLTLEAHQLFKQQQDLNFIGNIEGREVFSGLSDILICDGFTGNVLLKGMEGLAMFIAKYCKRELGRIPGVFQKFDYTEVGGAPLLGIEGISIVSHGSSKSKAVLNGLKTAEECVEKDIVKRQKWELGRSVS